MKKLTILLVLYLLPFLASPARCADSKISGLSEIDIPQALDDEIPIVDTSAATTKKVQLNNMLIPAYLVDSTESDQGVTGGGRTVKALSDTISSNPGLIVFANYSSGGTSFNFDTSLDLSTKSNLYFYFQPGAYLDQVTGDEVLQVYSPENFYSKDKCIDGDMVDFANGGNIYITWWTTADGTTVNDIGFQAAIDSCSAHGTRIKAIGKFRLNTSINLASHQIYDFTDAEFYPDAALDGSYIFYGSSKSDFDIIGGQFLDDTYSPTDTLATGTYINCTAIQITGCSNFTISGCRFEEYYGSINLYDSDNGKVQYTYSHNGNAGISVVAETAEVSDIDVSHNTVIGSGDDSYAFIARTGAFDLINSRCAFNYSDDTRNAGTASGIGIRATGKLSSGTGEIYNMSIVGNQIKDASDHAIYAHSIHESEICLNNIDGFANVNGGAIMCGAASYAVTRMLIAYNSMRDPQQTGNSWGIYGDSLDDSRIIGNEIEGDVATGFGSIYFNNSDNNIIAENKVSNATANSPAIHTAGTSTGNHIVNNKGTVNGASLPITLANTNYTRGNSFATGAMQGEATLVAGTITVSTNAVLAADYILLTRSVDAGTLGHLSVGTITANTSFVIDSSNAADTSTVFWEIVR